MMLHVGQENTLCDCVCLIINGAKFKGILLTSRWSHVSVCSVVSELSVWTISVSDESRTPALHLWCQQLSLQCDYTTTIMSLIWFMSWYHCTWPTVSQPHGWTVRCFVDLRLPAPSSVTWIQSSAGGQASPCGPVIWEQFAHWSLYSTSAQLKVKRGKKDVYGDWWGPSKIAICKTFIPH